jgi:hypothetical protein
MSTTIPLKSIVEAFELLDDEVRCYLNPDTGEIRSIGDDEVRAFEEDAAVPDSLPAWQVEALKSAREVLDSTDWLSLPTKFDIHEWEIMDQFASSLPDAQRCELRDALRGRGAFRLFKMTIRRFGVEDGWFRFREEALADIARSWLEKHNLPYDDSPVSRVAV